LEKLGANYVVLPELEGGLELIHNALLELKFPLQEVHAYTQAVRRDHYNLENISNEEHRSLDDLLAAFKGIEISWLNLEPDSPLINQTLADAGIRSKTGASLVALIRDGQLLANPKSQTVFLAGDRLGFIGESPQIEAVRKMIRVEKPD
jgi:CPA2 family monovalent cation:H+ antiporter-2